MTDSPTGQHILIVDAWESGFGRLLALIFGRSRSDHTSLVTGSLPALGLCRSAPPDALFMYLWAGDLDAMRFCDQLYQNQSSQAIPVVVWGALVPHRVYPELQAVGAAGYLLQPCTPAEALAARDTVLAGNLYYP